MKVLLQSESIDLSLPYMIQFGFYSSQTDPVCVVFYADCSPGYLRKNRGPIEVV